MKIGYFILGLWLVANISITVCFLMYKFNITYKGYLTIKDKPLWKILSQYVLLLPHMIFAWLCKLMKMTPFKSKSK